MPVNACGNRVTSFSIASLTRSASGVNVWRGSSGPCTQRARAAWTCANKSSGIGASAASVGRHQRLELDDSRLAVGDLALERRLVAILEAFEEQIARGAEALPDRF